MLRGGETGERRRRASMDGGDVVGTGCSKMRLCGDGLRRVELLLLVLVLPAAWTVGAVVGWPSEENTPGKG
jgi:hypothetical protein